MVICMCKVYEDFVKTYMWRTREQDRHSKYGSGWRHDFSEPRPPVKDHSDWTTVDTIPQLRIYCIYIQSISRCHRTYLLSLFNEVSSS